VGPGPWDNSEVKELFFTIPGKPVTWKRVNLWRGRLLEPKEQRQKKREIASLAMAAMMEQGWKRTGLPVEASCQFFGCHGGADLSNLIKLVEDALNRVVWEDDQQIYSFGNSAKFPRVEPQRTEVRIRFWTHDA